MGRKDMSWGRSGKGRKSESGRGSLGGKRSRKASVRGAAGGGRGGERGRLGKAELRRIFQAVDADGSGRIDPEELGDALSNGAWEPFNPGTLSYLMAMFDTDGDGTISEEEFGSLWDYVERWTETFRRYDRDGSGRVDARELGEALSAFGYRLSRSCVTALASRFDRSDQGGLAFDDFVQTCVVLDTITQTFKKRDVGRSGVVRFPFEDFVLDVSALVLRLQRPDAQDLD